VILSQRVKREQTAEEIRVLYVAMTRAKRKLILTACVSKPMKSWSLRRFTPPPGRCCVAAAPRSGS
jgi:ATP-dependent exoDNAse (exonuclease V) beta subunit